MARAFAWAVLEDVGKLLRIKRNSGDHFSRVIIALWCARREDAAPMRRRLRGVPSNLLALLEQLHVKAEWQPLERFVEPSHGDVLGQLAALLNQVCLGRGGAGWHDVDCGATSKTRYYALVGRF